MKILATLRRTLERPSTLPTPAEREHALQLALALVMLEVSYADFDIAPEELATIATVLRREFNLTEQECANLMELAIQDHHTKTSLHDTLRLLNNTLCEPDKLRLMKSLWRVARADQRIDKYEEYHLRKIAGLLYISHADFIRAKLETAGH